MKISGSMADNLIVYQIFSIVEFILLFLGGYLIGNFGYFMIIILTCTTIYIFSIYANGLRGSFSNNSSTKENKIYKDAIALTVIFLLINLFITYGVNDLINYIKYGVILSTLFYIWLAIFLSSIIASFAIRKKTRVIKGSYYEKFI